jgi:hypothetical protein
MSRKKISNQVLIFAAFALCAPTAFADDNSMSVLTGDSYSYFNDLDYNAGRYNAEHASIDVPRASDTVGPAVQQSHEARQQSHEALRQSAMLGARAHVTLPSPFSDRTAG